MASNVFVAMLLAALFGSPCLEEGQRDALRRNFRYSVELAQISGY